MENRAPEAIGHTGAYLQTLRDAHDGTLTLPPLPHHAGMTPTADRRDGVVRLGEPA
jgi:hypothetical protein